MTTRYITFITALLVVLMMSVTAFAKDEIVYSTMTVFSVSTSENVLILNSGCVFSVVSLEKAQQLNAVGVATLSESTSSKESSIYTYDSTRQVLTVKVPELRIQLDSFINQEETYMLAVQRYIIKKVDLYAKEILAELEK